MYKTVLLLYYLENTCILITIYLLCIFVYSIIYHLYIYQSIIYVSNLSSTYLFIYHLPIYLSSTYLSIYHLPINHLCIPTSLVLSSSAFLPVQVKIYLHKRHTQTCNIERFDHVHIHLLCLRIFQKIKKYRVIYQHYISVNPMSHTNDKISPKFVYLKVWVHITEQSDKTKNKIKPSCIRKNSSFNLKSQMFMNRTAQGASYVNIPLC